MWLVSGSRGGVGQPTGKTSTMLGGLPFCYVTEYERQLGVHRDVWKDSAFLFYTNNPLVVNVMKLGEVSLAVVEHGKVVLTNFVDFAREPLVERLKVYELGELWLSYATGGSEELLRFGGPRP